MISRKTMRLYEGLREIVNPGQGEITGVAIDSRILNKGEIFFALRSETADGHNYIPGAIKKGASLIVADEKWYDENKNIDAELWIVDDTLRALQEMARLHRETFKGKVIGLTGSNGKTTTKEMLYDVLSQKYKVLKNKGNFNNHLGVPLTLFNLDDSYEIAIVELGTNHPGEIERLCEIAEPDLGVITNIGSAHIGNFPGKDGLVREKLSLFDYVCKAGGVIFINTFDPNIRAYNCSGEVVKIGDSPDHFVYSSGVSINPETLGIDFDANGGNVRLRLPGFHNRYNALLAIAVGKYFGVSDSRIRGALENLKAPEQRMEMIEIGNLKIINDCYNASPESMETAISYASALAVQLNMDLHLILGDMLELGDKSPEYHREIKKYINPEVVKSIWLTGPNMEYLYRDLSRENYKFRVRYKDKTSSLTEALRADFVGSGIVLVKASRGTRLEFVMDILREKGRSEL